jgi:hypothetical protein
LALRARDFGQGGQNVVFHGHETVSGARFKAAAFPPR